MKRFMSFLNGPSPSCGKPLSLRSGIRRRYHGTNISNEGRGNRDDLISYSVSNRVPFGLQRPIPDCLLMTLHTHSFQDCINLSEDITHSLSPFALSGIDPRCARRASFHLLWASDLPIAYERKRCCAQHSDLAGLALPVEDKGDD
jgi:hypothetical protein